MTTIDRDAVLKYLHKRQLDAAAMVAAMPLDASVRGELDALRSVRAEIAAMPPSNDEAERLREALTAIYNRVTFPSHSMAGPFPPVLETPGDTNARLEYADKVLVEVAVIARATIQPNS